MITCPDGLNAGLDVIDDFIVVGRDVALLADQLNLR